MLSAVFLFRERVRNMSDFSFWNIYYPVLAALISSVAVFETVHFGIGYLMHKRQAKKYLEFQEKVQSGEIEMPPEMMGPMMPGMMGSYPFEIYPPPTTSGGDSSGTGQYL